jgi:hypothetical protein
MSKHPLQGPLRDLGWRSRFQYDDPEVVALRNELDAHAGIPGLEVIDPKEEGFAQHAATVFRRDGFCLIKDVLDPERLEILRSGCDRTIRHMLAHDDNPANPRVGNRGSHRYSFGSAPAHFGCQHEWSVMIDPPVLDAVLTAIFESDQYILGSGLTSGGDFNVPGSVEYQHLHRDTRNFFPSSAPAGLWLDTPPPVVQVNFPLEVVAGSTTGHTASNGVTRVIPGSHHSKAAIPSEQEEPRWMKMMTTGPIAAGSAMLRDLRTWHGGACHDRAALSHD